VNNTLVSLRRCFLSPIGGRLRSERSIPGLETLAQESTLVWNCLHTSNSSRFESPARSTVTKVPFLFGTFYWILNFAIYACIRLSEARLFFDTGCGTLRMHIEQKSSTQKSESFLFRREVEAQKWSMSSHPVALAFLSRAYSRSVQFHKSQRKWTSS